MDRPFDPRSAAERAAYLLATSGDVLSGRLDAL
jgi:hypothetical protein